MLQEQLNDGKDSSIQSDIYDPSIALYDVRFEGTPIGSMLYRGRVAFYSELTLADSSNGETGGMEDEEEEFQKLRSRIFLNKTSLLGLFGRAMYMKVDPYITKLDCDGGLEADGYLWFPWKMSSSASSERLDTEDELSVRGENGDQPNAGSEIESNHIVNQSLKESLSHNDTLDDSLYVPHAKWPLPPVAYGEKSRFKGYIAYLRVLGPGVIMGRLYSGYEGQFEMSNMDDRLSSASSLISDQNIDTPLRLNFERHFVLSRNYMADIPV